MKKSRLALSAPYSFQDMRSRVQNAILLSGLVSLSSYPWFVYQFQHLTEGLFAKIPSPQQVQLLALGQSIILFAIAILCSLVGFLYSERLHVPGFGRLRDALFWAPAGLAAGLALTPVSYYLLDRRIIPLAPEIFPRPWPWALSWMWASSISQEVVARFGLLTIGIYLLSWLNRRGWQRAAVLAVSSFGTVSTYFYFDRLGLDQRISPELVAVSLVSVFVFQWVFCEVYLRKGLVAAACLHFGLVARLMVYSVLISQPS